MITRLDVRKDMLGFLSIEDKVIPKNWVVQIDRMRSKIILISLSKAENRPDTSRIFTIDLKEGTLFLVNKTFEFYFYFRTKTVQDFYDKYNIEKVVSIKDNETVVPNTEINSVLVDPIVYAKGVSTIENEEIVEPFTDALGNQRKIFSNRFSVDGEAIIIQKIESGRYILYLTSKVNLLDLPEDALKCLKGDEI